MTAMMTLQNAMRDLMGGDKPQISLEGAPLCPKCGKPTAVFIKTSEKTFVCPQACDCKKKQAEKERLDRINGDKLRENANLRSDAGHIAINVRFSDLKENRGIKIAKNYADNWFKFKQSGLGLCFWGECGTGKTQAAAALVNEIAEKYSASTIIINISKLVENYSSTDFAKRADFSARLEKPDLLMIDDLGVEKDSKYVSEITYNLINSRYLKKKPIIATTNLTPSYFENKEDIDIEKERSYSRINEMCQLIKMDKPYRQQAAKIKKSEFVDLLMKGV